VTTTTLASKLTVVVITAVVEIVRGFIHIREFLACLVRVADEDLSVRRMVPVDAALRPQSI